MLRLSRARNGMPTPNGSCGAATTRTSMPRSARSVEQLEARRAVRHDTQRDAVAAALVEEREARGIVRQHAERGALLAVLVVEDEAGRAARREAERRVVLAIVAVEVELRAARAEADAGAHQAVVEEPEARALVDRVHE